MMQKPDTLELGKDEEAVKLIDAHMHIRPAELGPESDVDLNQFVESIIGQMEPAGVKGGIIASNTMEHDQLDMVTRRYGEHFIGLLNMLPDMERNLAEIDKYGHNPSIIGLKVYPNLWEGSAFIRHLQPVLDEIKDRRWIIQVHSNPVVFEEVGLPLQVRQLAWRVDLPVVMVHSGGHQFLQLYNMVDDTPENLFFDTSAIQNIFCDTPFRSHVAWLFERLSDHLFWASDYPGFSFESAHTALEKYGFSDQEMADICYHNCARFLRRYVGDGINGFAGLGTG